MLDADLAELYGVPTKVFNQAVKRNAERFPEDFMFQITRDEAESLRSQIVTLKKAGRGGGPAGYHPGCFCPKDQRNVLVTIHKPATIMHTPMARLTQCPAGTIFSTRTYAAIVATQSRFITPATNSSAIRSQQQPTQ